MVLKANYRPTAGMAHNLDILNGKYPAKAHAKKVAEYVINKGGNKNGVLYLEGQKLRMIEVSLFLVPVNLPRRYRIQRAA
jgi:hypothetical protein